MKLNDLKIGEEGVIKKVIAKENIRRRLMELGFLKGISIKPVLKNKSMTAYKLKGTVISIRKEDTADIEVTLWELV